MSGTGFLDAHLHLQDARFGKHLDEVLERALHRGVNCMLCNATREDDWNDVLRIAMRFPAVVPYLGVHPWYADTVTPGWQQRFSRLIEQSGCGIGEIGLDKYCRVDAEQQKAVFTAQLHLASQYKRPVAIHCVRCWGHLFTLLEASGVDFSVVPVMIHSYNGSLETMKRLVDMGVYISFSMGILGLYRGKAAKVFIKTPVDRVLLETDAPDQGVPAACAPEIADCNEPMCITELYRQAAQLKNMDLQELQSVVRSNGKIFTNPSTVG